MSRFYRSSTASSSSSSISSSDDVEQVNEVSRDRSESTVDLVTALDGLALPQQPAGTQLHRDILLHTLLEERCLNEVRNERRGSWDELTINAEAKRRYQLLSAQLSAHSLVSSGLEHDRMADTRQRYRRGLDMLSQGNSSMERNQRDVPASLRRLLTDGSATSTSFGISQPTPLNRELSDASSVFDSFTSSHPILELSRYHREFEELGILGKGGYGMVFRVKHRLDGSEYAVKKVPISQTRMARIRSRGQLELDDLLRELRTMARLDHPNVVRYHAGWIEWTNLGGPASNGIDMFSRGGGDTDFSHAISNGQAVTGAQDPLATLGRVITQSDSDTPGIVFENSLSSDHAFVQHSPRVSEVLPDTSIVSDTGLDGLVRSTKPTLALHMQMGLYPLSLAEFISPAQVDSTIPLAHCFHLGPSINIILSLLDGIEYLHAEGMVHRDLKPANVFLAANTNPRNTAGSVDLFLCTTCRELHQAQPVTLNVRIGDFGLVTAVAQPEDQAEEHIPAVGTEIYRPLHAVADASASLDIYALGIIAFELLWPFGTRMERHDTLQRLKTGEFPSGFSTRIDDQSGRMQGCIRAMLSQGDSEVTITALKERMMAVQGLHPC